MAKAKDSGQWGPFRGPGTRRTATTFDRAVSPLGEDMVENPSYSPSHAVEGAKSQRTGGAASRSESARDQRRGG